MGLLSDGAEFLRDTLLSEDVGGVEVTYSRHGETSITGLVAMRGRSNFRTTDSEGRSILIVSDRDYIVDPDDITYGDPKRGDRIADDGQTYEVWPVIPGESHFKKCDEDGALIRLHCKRV